MLSKFFVASICRGRYSYLVIMDPIAAERLLRTFSSSAYTTARLMKYQEATQMLHGLEWNITVNLQNRMMFFCTICKKEMNCTNAVTDHARSGSHNKMKNVVEETKQKQVWDIQKTIVGLRDKLQASDIKPIGVHMLCEYQEAKEQPPYYICKLCSSHGSDDTMFLHLVGNLHTDNYITSRIRVPNNVVQSQQRERFRNFILHYEGTGILHIDSIVGTDFYPYRLAYEGMRSNWSSMESIAYPGSSPYVSEVRSTIATDPSSLVQTIAAARSHQGRNGTTAEVTKMLSQVKVSAKSKPEIKTHKMACKRVEHHMKAGKRKRDDLKKRAQGCKDPGQAARHLSNVQSMSYSLGLLQKKVLPMAMEALEKLEQ